jgi:hypothetical protein
MRRAGVLRIMTPVNYNIARDRSWEANTYGLSEFLDNKNSPFY